MRETRDTMGKYMKWILAALAVLVLGMAAAVIVLIEPYWSAGSAMPNGAILTITQRDSGELHLQWPESETADAYLVEVVRPGQGPLAQAETLYARYVESGTSCVLPNLESEDALTIRVSSAVKYIFLNQERIRLGSNDLEMADAYNIPTIQNLSWEANPEENAITVSLNIQKGDTCRLYVMDNSTGELNLLRTITESKTKITFGENADVAMPTYSSSCTFAFDVYRKSDHAVCYGSAAQKITISREDLLGTSLGLACEDQGDNTCVLTWNETKGDYYEVQIRNDTTGEWMTLERIERGEELTYTSPQMQRFRSFRFRVVALGGQTLPDSKYAAISETVRFTTGVSVAGSTIWPMQKLNVYSDPQKTGTIGSVSAGAAYCALELKEGMFRIRCGDDVYGYIDSNYCMINLVEFMGSLCSYDIINSYASRYMVHGYEIPSVTETVILGYEDIQLASGNYLVPLLYPAAKKLVDAAGAAMDQGYRLKIYDSFRPHKATTNIYNVTKAILSNQIPKEKYVFADGSGDKMGSEQWKAVTYQKMMTNGQYSLGHFLAAGNSAHNYGVALDLTLEQLSTGEELVMQTSMHDLSWYSVVSRNNQNANILDKIMKGAGFGGLVSEWWHFQDNDALNGLGLQALEQGVSGQCWMKDENGWKYRSADGNYLRSCTRTIDGKSYTFNEYGYVVS